MQEAINKSIIDNKIKFPIFFIKPSLVDNNLLHLTTFIFIKFLTFIHPSKNFSESILY